MKIIIENHTKVSAKADIYGYLNFNFVDKSLSVWEKGNLYSDSQITLNIKQIEHLLEFLQKLKELKLINNGNNK